MTLYLAGFSSALPLLSTPNSNTSFKWILQAIMQSIIIHFINWSIPVSAATDVPHHKLWPKSDKDPHKILLCGRFCCTAASGIRAATNYVARTRFKNDAEQNPYVAWPTKSSAVKVSLSMIVRLSLYWSSAPGYRTLNVNLSFHTGFPPFPASISFL